MSGWCWGTLMRTLQDRIYTRTSQEGKVSRKGGLRRIRRWENSEDYSMHFKRKNIYEGYWSNIKYTDQIDHILVDKKRQRW